MSIFFPLDSCGICSSPLVFKSSLIFSRSFLKVIDEPYFLRSKMVPLKQYKYYI
jgi:hypothetical protein